MPVTTTNTNNIIDPTNIFELENQVIADLNAFNKAYQTYIICKNTNTYFNDRKGDAVCGNDSALGNLTTAYKKLINEDNGSNKTGSLYLLNEAINALPTEALLQSGTIKKKAEYLNNYRVLMRNYENVLKKRQALDANLTELYEIGDTGTNFYQKKLISTSYTKILLTILATTLTVAAFMTMRNKQ